MLLALSCSLCLVGSPVQAPRLAPARLQADGLAGLGTLTEDQKKAGLVAAVALAGVTVSYGATLASVALLAWELAQVFAWLQDFGEHLPLRATDLRSGPALLRF